MENARSGSIARIPWGWVVPVLIGLGIGAWWGTSYAWLDSGPSSGPFPATFGLTILAFLGGGPAGLLAILLLLPERTRPAGFAGLRLLGGAVLGAAIGMAVGPRYQFGGDVMGTLQMRLTSPVAATLESEAVCEIEDNGTTVEAIGTPVLGDVGVDRLAAHVDIGPNGGRIRVLVNEGSGYEAAITGVAADPGRRSGSASFSGDHAGRYRIGGERGSESIAGDITWQCSDAPAPSADPDPSRASQDPMQGWFSLRGIVDMPHPCSAEGPCLPYGRAMATCYRDVPFRANHFETVVPWIGESRARLVLELDGRSATLAVQVDDGSPPERASGTGSISEQLLGGHSYRRVASADVVLAAGPLHVEVEYSCSDNVEPYPGEDGGTTGVGGSRPGAGGAGIPGPIGTPVAVGVNGWLATASGATHDGAIRRAFDGNRQTFWNAGAGPVQWIQVDLGGPRTLRVVRLIPEQTPAGPTVHQVLAGPTIEELVLVHEFSGSTRSDIPVVQTFAPAIENVRYVRILTISSPSWVAWREIELAVD